MNDHKNTIEEINKLEDERLLILQFMNRYKAVVAELEKVSSVLSHNQVITRYPTSMLMNDF